MSVIHADGGVRRPLPAPDSPRIPLNMEDAG
jgi:hypothetical protein